MKKTLVFVAAGVFLGFIVMMLPVALQAGLQWYQPGAQPFTMNTQAQYGDTRGESSSLRFFATAGQPESLLPSSLIFFSGLVIALGAYIVVRKRMI